jgi:phage tail sheath gpL-like
LTLEDTLIPRLNFSNFGQVEPDSTLWKISAPLNGAAPTPVQIDTALNNGITPIGVDIQGKTYLVKRITTSTNPGIRDAGKVTVSDRFGDDLKVKLSTQFAGALIGNDPKDQGQPPPGPNTLTPNRLKNAISLLVDTYFKRELLQNVDEIKASIVTTREPTPPTRMTGRVALQVVDIADQIGIVVNQTPADLFT